MKKETQELFDQAIQLSKIPHLRKKAFQIFEQALALEPSDHLILFNLGLLWEEEKELAKALDCYEKTIAANPNFCIAYLHKGYVLSKQHEYDQAEEAYLGGIKYIQPYPEHLATVWYNLAHLYFLRKKEGDWERLKKANKMALKYDPSHRQALMMKQTIKNIDKEKEKTKLSIRGFLSD